MVLLLVVLVGCLWDKGGILLRNHAGLRVGACLVVWGILQGWGYETHPIPPDKPPPADPHDSLKKYHIYPFTIPLRHRSQNTPCCKRNTECKVDSFELDAAQAAIGEPNGYVRTDTTQVHSQEIEKDIKQYDVWGVAVAETCVRKDTTL